VSQWDILVVPSESEDTMKKSPYYPKWLDSVKVEEIPVQVVIYRDGRLSSQSFPNIAEAKMTYPELEPYCAGNTFTPAMRGELNGSPALRFETYEAYNILSV
jgi:hypothetical protein